MSPINGIDALSGCGRSEGLLRSRRMNVHHLELFYYVAKHGGISRAVRAMPYGIQQPAVSGQLRALETELGVRLFERTPFRLTAAGVKLQQFVEPFFGRLESVREELRTGDTPVLRLGAAEVALRDHVPEIAAQLRKKLPGLRLKMRAGLQAQLAGWLKEGEIDLAIAATGTRSPAGLRCKRLLRLRLALLVPARARYRDAEDFFARKPVEVAHIGLPATEAISREFERALRARGVNWPMTIEANSLFMIAQYVAQGQGVGVSLDWPGLARVPGVKALPLADATIEIAALWRDEPTPLIQAFLAEAERHLAEQPVGEI